MPWRLCQKCGGAFEQSLTYGTPAIYCRPCGVDKDGRGFYLVAWRALCHVVTDLITKMSVTKHQQQAVADRLYPDVEMPPRKLPDAPSTIASRYWANWPVYRAKVYDASDHDE
jgi:hypothetical protein